MKAKFGFIDPGAIMGVVVALVVLGVGAFAVFITLSKMQQMNPFSSPSATTSLANNASWTEYDRTFNNSTTISNNVFNILGVVMIIGAIMTIVGLVYNYVR